jgi:MinD-like ATPase involved in chromosome partitioning or flagellar assembly
MARVFAFVSNRGGSGKSTLVSQLGPAIALANPGAKVLVLDFSIQQDTSVILLGGTQQPDTFQPGIRSKGAEVIANLPPQQRALGLVRAIMTPPQKPSFWRGMVSTSAQDAPLDFEKYCVQPSIVHPTGRAPANLFVAAGGPELYNFEPITQAISLASKMREYFARLSNTIILIDTDAELSERVSSLIGIASAQSIAVVLSSAWNDYERLHADKANGFFECLRYLTHNDQGFDGKVMHVIFNNVVKRINDPSTLAESLCIPFTPPADNRSSMEDIVTHLYSVCANRESNYKMYFSDPGAFKSATEFAQTYVTGVSAIPTTVLQQSLSLGQSIMMQRSSAPQEAASSQLTHVAKRFSH